MLFFAAFCLVLLELVVGNCSVSTTNSSMSVCHGRVRCPSCISVSWYERKPYVYRVDNRTQGILPDILKILLNECCANQTPSCWKVNHSQPVKDVKNLLYDPLNAIILYPVIVNTQDPEDTMVAMVPPTSIALVVLKSERESFPKKLLMSVFEAWPVLILTFLLSILAGIILWLAEIRVNPEEFPRSFIRGSWEGFWWAFVSMTTVGYGDRSPRSFPGRMFAVCWILVGICIVSIFTATLTTALTTISMSTKTSITGAKIGVLEGSIELSTAMQQQTDIEVFSKIEDLRKALDSRDVGGALLDKYIISHYKYLFPDKIFKVDQVLSQDKMSYGAIVNDTQLNSCFKQVFRHDRFVLYNYIKNELQRSLKSAEGKEAVKNSQSIFDPTGDLFYPSMYSCVILVIIIIAVGIVVEFLYLRPRRCILRLKESYDLKAEEIEMTKIRVKELEQEMLQEINKIIEKYQEKMKQQGLVTDEKAK